MLIDLHAHYPMHLHEGAHAGIPLRRWLTERPRAELVNLISKLFNYQGPGDTPSVTMQLIADGDVGVVLSVLYWPFDEIEPGIACGEAPGPGGPGHLLDQLQLVEDHVTDKHPGVAVVVTDRAGLELALEDRQIGVVHCVEGGFALGATAEQVGETVAVLAGRGVAYVTLAHLFFRQVATNAPALPFLSDDTYDRVFPQPGDVGLAALGLDAVDALLEHRVVIDLTHMTERAMAQTLDRVERQWVPGQIPVIASHGACRLTNGPAYNLSDTSVTRIARLGGVIGLICCTHYIAFGQPSQPARLSDSLDLLCLHIDQIAELTGGYDHIAIGSDLDGYIKPALPGLESIDKMRSVEPMLIERYGPQTAEQICSGNALRMLRYRFPTGAPLPAH